MPITLDDGKSLPTKLLNSIRIKNIPLINFVIMSILAFFLLRLTTKYTGLYMKNSLITIIVTNLVLFGISETLAQTILCYDASEPRITVKIDNPVPDIEAAEAIDEPQHIERFIDYIQDNDEISMTLYEYTAPAPQPAPLTFYQFNRLAGFMVWGFVLAFAQCWWYKFLQIYAKDPKFIEVLRKVLTDQLCYSPVSLFAFFSYGTMVLENGTWDDTKDKLNRIYLKTLMINYSVWFPVQFINFLLVPRDFQVPFSSSVSVLWNCFLSMRNSG